MTTRIRPLSMGGLLVEAGAWTNLTLANSFGAQAGNPPQYQLVRNPSTGRAYLRFRGGIVTPSVVPLANTSAATNVPSVACGQYVYLNFVAGTGFGVSGRRSRWLISGTTLTWMTGGADVANEVTDMSIFPLLVMPDGV